MKQKGVLPNSYVPVIPPKSLAKMLARLPLLSLLKIAQLWTKLKNTTPKLTSEDKSGNVSQKQLNEMAFKEFDYMKEHGFPKRKVIDKILAEYWYKGLNLLQISQVDCQLIVDRPNAYYWLSSTAFNSRNEESVISLNPQKFLESVMKDLSSLYLTYVYVCRHPTYPLVIIRIQVFDLQTNTMILKAKSNRQPHIISRKPYLVAIPMNSPHVIHSPGDDIVCNIILQSIERNLSTPSKTIRLITSKEKPIRSLESMHIFKGVSRFSNSLGVWTPYADGTVDISPLAAPETHAVFEENNKQKDNVETEEQMLSKLATLRFKGTLSGLTSERLYDDIRPVKKRKLANDVATDDYELNDDYEEIRNTDKNEFSSIAPVQYVEFLLKEKIADSTDVPEITLKLSGSDIFGGLHELASKGVLDPTATPDWLTGEEGGNSGVIENRTFEKLHNIQSLL